jgi:hypothetical protein
MQSTPTADRGSEDLFIECHGAPVVHPEFSLVSCALLLRGCIDGPDLDEVVGEGVEDLVGGLGPGNGLGFSFQVAIQLLDVGFQSLDGGVDAAADEFVGQQAEPALYMVDPGGSGRGEVDVEAGVCGQPRLDLCGVVSGVVVAYRKGYSQVPGGVPSPPVDQQQRPRSVA